MRILRVAQKWYPSVTGGGAYHVHAMSRDQAAMGHDVTVLTVAQDGESPGREEHDGYTVIKCRPRAEVLGNAIAPGVARHLATAPEYDVVHAHSHLYFSTNLAAVARRLGSTPLAITNHGLYSQSAPETVFEWYLRTLGRWTFDTADCVFCYSDTDRDRLRELGVETQVDVVANGIDETRFVPDGPASDLIDTDSPAVLFVGRLTEGKRPGDAIAAVERVRETIPDATLYLAGDGELRGDLEATVAERGLTDAVRFLGHVEYDAMPALYRTADVLVLPSRAEGMPRTVLEALSTGTPVVTSDLPQLQSITDTAGASVPVGDVPELATELHAILDDAEAARAMGRRGREIVTQQYTWSETVAKTTDTLASL